MVGVASHERTNPQRQEAMYYVEEPKNAIAEMPTITEAVTPSTSTATTTVPAESAAVRTTRRSISDKAVDQQSEVPSEIRSRKSSSSSQISSKSKRLRKEEMTREFENCLEQSEIRSRKSSSSSQISSKSKRLRKEEMTREFENCLEQVLTWLLEAEDELNQLEAVDENDLKVVRKQFKDFEMFMSSLTESQDTVGRVLHRGQMLCGKAENEEERAAIEGQLRVVSGRWEELRELSMQRQNDLQLSLNKLQNAKLASIEKWLNEVESERTSCKPIASTAEAALQQIETHTRLQAKIHDFQDTINDLSSFVAVVDDAESSDERIGLLEQRLHLIGERWRSICEWAEYPCESLQELLGLKSAHHLDDPQQIAEQVRKLQNAEEALEAEHGSFVKLSQLSCELVARLEKGNGAAANEVRRKLDTVTQRWDNLVSRIEEHSRMLVQSGKADVRQLKRVQDLPTGASTSAIISKTKSDRMSQKTKTAKDTVVFAPTETTTDTETEEASDQVRKMINVCQEKLIEIKDQEAKVNRLQLELEHMHLSSSLSSAQLKKVNDAFENFAKKENIILEVSYFT
ncbi:spectrin repeat-containing domain protein [Dictyocaulus viviparus]|uniref:Spectrin repeat-containing domain protein n=1 Tax=Dictyocaulus viviparus TaxID=29172 RepID=A0A0D8Y4N3_DICVI|nr:spectrin repeat-containing domain protein [Dictyocaulus viviparus]